jgi:hypothetical protein
MRYTRSDGFRLYTQGGSRNGGVRSSGIPGWRRARRLQAGVYQALHETGVEPDWIIGTSIGVINLPATNRRIGRNGWTIEGKLGVEERRHLHRS